MDQFEEITKSLLELINDVDNLNDEASKSSQQTEDIHRLPNMEETKEATESQTTVVQEECETAKTTETAETAETAEAAETAETAAAEISELENKSETINTEDSEKTTLDEAECTSLHQYDVEDAYSSCSESLGECLADRSASVSSISSTEGEQEFDVDEEECSIEQTDDHSMKEENTCIVEEFELRSLPLKKNLEVLGTLERVQLTKSVWLLNDLTDKDITNILKGRETGIFLVKGPDKNSGGYKLFVSKDKNVKQYTINVNTLKGLHVAGSQRYFDNIQSLITYYINQHNNSDDLRLTLHQSIREASSQKDLNSLAQQKKQFWDQDSSLKSDDIRLGAPRATFQSHPLSKLQRLKRQTSTDSGSDVVVPKRVQDLASRYGLMSGQKSDASILTSDDEDFLSKRPLSEHDLNDSFGMEASNWTYRKISNMTTDISTRTISSEIRRPNDLTWNLDSELENSFTKRLSDDALSVSTPGLTPSAVFSSTPRKQKEVFTFQTGRGYSIPSCLHSEYRGESTTKSLNVISENKTMHHSYTLGATEPDRYHVKFGSQQQDVSRVASPSIGDYTFKIRKASLPVTSQNTVSNGEIYKTDCRQTTSSYLIRDNAPPVKLKSNEVILPGSKSEILIKSGGKISAITNMSNTNPKQTTTVFKFQSSADNSLTNKKARLMVSDSAPDAERQPSPIYAIPCDALINRTEHSRDSVNAIRASAKQSSMLKSMSAIDYKRLENSGSKQAVTVQRSSSDRTPRTTRFMDVIHDIPIDTIDGRPPLPKSSQISNNAQNDAAKIGRYDRSQSLWTFNGKTNRGDAVNYSATEIGKENKQHYEPVQQSSQIYNGARSVSRSVEQYQTVLPPAKPGLNNNSPESDQLDFQFFTPPSSCEIKDNSSKSLLKFPTPPESNTLKTDIKSKQTVEDVISIANPNVTLRKSLKPFQLNTTNRISAYDNVSNSRPPSIRRNIGLSSSRTTLASTGTRYSQPWENWETLIGEVAEFETRQFAERDDKAEDYYVKSSPVININNSQMVNNSTSQMVTGTEAVLAENIKENKAFTNPHRRNYETKSLTRPVSKSSESPVIEPENSKYLTTGRKGLSQIQLSKARSATRQGESSRLLIETNDNFEYSEMESVRADSEYFGMDVEIRPDGFPFKTSNSQSTFERSLDRRSFLLTGSEASFSQQKSPDVIPLITGPKLISDKNRGHKHPGAKICYHIVDMSKRDDLFFGRMVKNFVDCTIKGQERNPRTVTQNIRQFMNGMKNYLVRQGEKELNAYIDIEQSKMNQNDFLNIDAIMERALLKCVVKPLHDFVYKLFVEEATKNGSLEQLSDSIKMARTLATEDLGLSDELISQHETAIEYSRHFLTLMEKSYSPVKKLENILGAVTYISNAICSESFNSSHPSASPSESNDVLRLLTYVLVQHGLISAEIEADYTWGLVHQSFLTGESRYHLATFSSAVNIIKSLKKQAEQSNTRSSTPIEGFLQIVVPNERQDKFGRHLLPVHPSMVTRDICSLMAHRLKLTNPQDYGLYSLVAKVERKLKDDASPQNIHTQALSNFQDCVLVYRRNNATFIWPRDL